MMAEDGQTTDGKAVEVIDAGLYNRRGKDPDFFNAKLKNKRHTMGRQCVCDGERIRLVSVRNGQGQVV